MFTNIVGQGYGNTDFQLSINFREEKKIILTEHRIKMYVEVKLNLLLEFHNIHYTIYLRLTYKYGVHTVHD